MHVYTDDQSYAEKVIPKIQSWEKQRYGDLNPDIHFVNNIISPTNIFHSDLQFSDTWKYLIISKIASKSQFDLLYNLSNRNPDLPGGIICIADAGKNFHGYRNRQWQALSGNLHLSIFIKPNQFIEKFHIGFTIIAAVSLIQTLNSIKVLNVKPGIKWVNDILINNSKIGGVITQTQTQQDHVTGVVLGIGLNIEKSPGALNDSVVGKGTSLSNHVSKNKINFSNIFFTLLQKLENNYRILLAGKYQELLDIYRQNSIIIGKTVEIYSDTRDGEQSLLQKGTVAKIGDDLELYLNKNNEPIRQGRLKLIA